MNRIIKTIFLGLLFLGVFGITDHASAADRYWVGGSGNWSDDDNHWASSSGGAPADGNLPTATDNVFFDSNSHTTNYTVTIDATTKLCNDLTFAAPAAGNVTLAGVVQITISGSLTLYSGLVRTYTGPLLFNSTSSGETLTFAGVTMASATTFNGAGGGSGLSKIRGITEQATSLSPLARFFQTDKLLPVASSPALVPQQG